MENTGFTKSYRAKWQNPIFRNLLEAGIWAWLCDTAVWEETRIRFNGELITLQRGQLLTSIRFISKGFDIGEQKVRTFLDHIESDGMINTQPTHKGTLITICNYEKYQQNANSTNTPTNTPLTHGFEEINNFSSKNDTPNDTQPTHTTYSNTSKNSIRVNSTNTPTNTPLTHDQHTANTNNKEDKKLRSKEYTDDCITPASVKEIFAWLERFFNSPVPYITAPIEAWLNWGADFEKDIKPAAERFMKRKGSPPRSLKWLDEEIAKSIEQRKQPMPDVKTENYHIRGENAVSVTEHNNAIIEGLKKKIKAEEEARL